MNYKEYAQQYRERLAKGESKEDILDSLQSQFLKEVGGILKTKKPKNDVTLLYVLKEQDSKWRSMSRLETDIPSTGFVYGIFSVLPDMYEAAEVIGFLELFKKKNP